MKRRNFLQTASGALALPWLESFAGGRALAAKQTTSIPPIRFLTLFFPNGVYPAAWKATQGDSGLLLEEVLAPLQPFADRAVVIDGLDNPLGGHLGQTSGFLSGHDFLPDEDGTVRGAVSLDQMLAQHWWSETYLPSLNLAVEPPSQGGFGNRPRSYGNSISWSSPTTKIEPQINPQQAFDQVFFGQTAAGQAAAARRKRIVDAVWEDAKALTSRVSSSDARRLAQYLDSIADLETKLEKTLHPELRSWTPPHSADPIRPSAAGIPSNHEEHLHLMLEVMLLALQTDSTRVGTMVMGHSISRIVYDFVDRKLKRNHHDFSHHRNDPEKIAGYNEISKWFSRQCARMLERMDAIDEGNGTLLDNSTVLFGSGMKDGNVHDPIDVPVALFGSAGGKLKTNRLIHAGEDAVLSQLHLSLLRLHGVAADGFNEVTSRPVPGFA